MCCSLAFRHITTEMPASEKLAKRWLTAGQRDGGGPDPVVPRAPWSPANRNPLGQPLRLIGVTATGTHWADH
ncbi:unnamed protein product [Boreogadus saida]